MNQEVHSRKERLAERLAQQKIRFARKQLVEMYQRKLPYDLKPEQFIDIALSHTIKEETYLRIAKMDGSEVQSYTEALELLRNLIKADEATFAVKNWHFYYLDTLDTGGITIDFKDFRALLQSIGDTLQTDILLVSENMDTGVCIELEEHRCTLKKWGV